MYFELELDLEAIGETGQLGGNKIPPSNLLLSNCCQGSKGPVSFPSAAFRNSLTSVWFATLWTSPSPDDAKSEGSVGDPPKPGGQWHPGGHWSVPKIWAQSILSKPIQKALENKYHLLLPISTAGFFVFRENLGVFFYSYWWETVGVYFFGVRKQYIFDHTDHLFWWDFLRECI